jgi:hypothetical protein
MNSFIDQFQHIELEEFARDTCQALTKHIQHIASFVSLTFFPRVFKSLLPQLFSASTNSEQQHPKTVAICHHGRRS